MARNSAAALEKLPAFIRDGASKPFDWTRCNCAFWVCDWIKLVSGIDPMESLRKQFRNGAEFRGHVRRCGGNEVLARNMGASAGFTETTEPKVGDVGLVHSHEGPMLAIKVPGGWAAKSGSGVVIAQFAMITAWAI
jgi:hypothetical protein